MELYKIFDREQYSKAYAFAKENGYIINRIGNNQYQIVERPVIVQPEPTYAELRQQEYPPIEEQLDMIYWDKMNGTNLWQETITEIKEKYPKPVEPIEEIEELPVVEEVVVSKMETNEDGVQ